jgi:peptidoglycan hydrolase CwlO-like protein
MMEVTISVTLIISVATFLLTIGGSWFVTQRRINELEKKVQHQDVKHDQIITDINDLKVQLTKVQKDIEYLRDSNVATNEKIESLKEFLGDKMNLIIDGKIKGSN